MGVLFRIWLCTALCALGVAVGVVLCITGPLDRRLEASRSRRVLNDRHHTRSWLSISGKQSEERLALQVESPALLRAAQQSRSEPADDPHATLNAQLRSLSVRLGGDLLLLDEHRRLHGRAGSLDRSLVEKLGGSQFLPSQIVVMGSRLVRLTTASLGEHLGTLLLAEELGAQTARKLRGEVDSEIAFVSRHQVYGSSAEAVAIELAESSGEPREEVRDRVVRKQHYWVASFPIVEGTDLVCLLFAGRNAPGSLWSLVGELEAKDLAEQWTLLALWAGLWVVLVIVGLVALQGTYDRPIAELLRETQNLARGGSLRLRDNEGAPFLQPLERAINAALERVALAERRQSRGESSGVHLVNADALPVAPAVLRGADEAATSFAERHNGRPRSEASPGLTPLAQTAPAASQAQNVPREVTAPPILDPGGSEAFVPPPQVTDHLTESDVGSRLELRLDGAAQPIDEDVRRLFGEFIATKERCGEALDGVTLDRFASKLEANRQLIASSYGCSDVRFRIFVKDGKAALKAIPVK